MSNKAKATARPSKVSLKVAGYEELESLGNGEFLLTDSEGNKELWFANKNHASFGIRHKNTHLEFARSINQSK